MDPVLVDMRCDVRLVPLFEDLQRAVGVVVKASVASAYRTDPTVFWKEAPFTADDIADMQHRSTLLAWDTTQVLKLVRASCDSAAGRGADDVSAPRVAVARVFGDPSPQLAQLTLSEAYHRLQRGEAAAADALATAAWNMVQQRLLPGVAQITILWLRARICEAVRCVDPRSGVSVYHRVTETLRGVCVCVCLMCSWGTKTVRTRF